jgi:glycine/D-amino acid oxidase-like deaminating enzyme
MDTPTTPTTRHTVIVGGGVMGCCTAYFLTRHPQHSPAHHRITLLEACAAVAPGASGKAGGLLAMWAHPHPLVPLSYRLHAELAAEHGGAERWGYREVQCGAIVARVGLEAADERKALRAAVDRASAGKSPSPHSEQGQPPADGQKPWEKLPKLDAAARTLFSGPSPLPPDLDYVDPACVSSWSEMGATPEEAATAQVHPLQFTTAMAELAAAAGVTVITNAHVTAIAPSSSGDPSARRPLTVTYTDRVTGTPATIADATDVVVAAGPWTGVLLPKSKIAGLRAHSIALRANVSPHVLFTSIQLPAEWVPAHRERGGNGRRKHGAMVDPEIYARPNGEVYLCGES